MYTITPDLVLEIEDLYQYDDDTGNIKIDKQIFDDYEPDSYIKIQFIEDNAENVYNYAMVAETDDYIECEYVGVAEEDFDD